MEEDIKILEEKIKQWEPYKNRRFKITDIEYEISKENKALENLIKRYKELKENNNQLKLYIKDMYISRGEYDKAKTIMTNELREYINKSVIREKIEEIKRI